MQNLRLTCSHEDLCFCLLFSGREKTEKTPKAKNPNNLGMFVKNMKYNTKAAGQIKCSSGPVY